MEWGSKRVARWWSRTTTRARPKLYSAQAELHNTPRTELTTSESEVSAALPLRCMSPATGDCPPGLHVMIIMDGSGRWAQARGLPRSEGHRVGAAAVRRVVEAAPRLGIGTLTLFAFSSDNWQRPAREVAGLMAIFEDYLATALRVAAERGVRTSVIGRRDRLPRSLGAAVEAAEAATRAGQLLHLRLAIDYSGRAAMLWAGRRIRGGRACSAEQFARILAGDEPVPDVDLVIRTGGEQRLSDCPLWEIAYAELIFVERLWPDFDAADLEAALREFRARDRRFGRIEEAVSR